MLIFSSTFKSCVKIMPISKIKTKKEFGRRKRVYWKKAALKKSTKQKVAENGAVETGDASSSMAGKKLDILVKKNNAKAVKLRSEENFVLVSRQSLQSAISMASCPKCKGPCEIKMPCTQGLAIQLKVICSSCGSVLSDRFTSVKKEYDVDGEKHMDYIVNHKVAMAAKKSGIEFADMNEFLSVWGIMGSLENRNPPS